MRLQAKECWQPAEAGGGMQSPQKELVCQHLASRTGGNTFPVFKPPSWWSLVPAAPGNEHAPLPALSEPAAQSGFRRPFPNPVTLIKASSDHPVAKVDGQFSAVSTLDLASLCPSRSPFFAWHPGHLSPLWPLVHWTSKH